MKTVHTLTLLALFLLQTGLPAQTETKPTPKASPATRTVHPAPKALNIPDILLWKSIRGITISHDGQWMAYQLAPTEGDSEVIVRQTQGDKEFKFPAGDGRGGGSVIFSEDGKWLAFSVHPTAKETKQLQKQRKPVHAKAALVALPAGTKTEFDHVQRFSFSGEMPGWLALHKYPAENQGTGSEKWIGCDLILRELSTGNEQNIGNVSEFAFDKKGTWLALVIDAQGQSGNGVLLRNMATAALTPLDSGNAAYRGLTWTEKGDGLAVLKGVVDKGYEDKLYSVLGFTDFTARNPQKAFFDPAADKSFPAGTTISPARNPLWTEDLSGLLFGIHELKKKEEKTGPKESPKDESKKDQTEKKPDKTKDEKNETPPKKEGNASAKDEDKEKPDLVVWHWMDKRLQAQQQKDEGGDKNFNYLCTYRVQEKKFIRLANEKLRTVQPAPKQRWALGYDYGDYELNGLLDGRDFEDIYVIDLETGAQRLAVKKNPSFSYFRNPFVSLSPDGSHFLFYDDGHFYTYEMATGKIFNISKEADTSFVNEERDVNVVKPPRNPIGWAKNGVSVLLSDGWDVWNAPVHGGPLVNLTVNGKKDGLRYQQRFVLDREEKGIDLSGSVYFSVYGEWTKKTGIVRIDGGKPGAHRLLWDDAVFGSVMKAKHSDVFLYTRETVKDFPDYHVTDGGLQNGRRLTQANPQQEQYLWSKGSLLVNYTSTKGKKLQGALFLPAHYEESKRYPTIMIIYEKLSNGLNRYLQPGLNSYNPAVFTSHGYAVLMPDIVYELNNPGRSAVWCVLPALEAAIATGVVDRERVALHGHSWGGYQTAFLITQTDAFRAAVAGAPLTNMVSMYSSIYWNIGIPNQPIFESSQGRFTGGYWENLEAYTRNSPVYYAKNVKTPLLLLHNDKDGAVDWNQGIEYFNTLRRLRKPVILLQYKGENHGLAKPANQKDYLVRLLEFFDHHLQDKPASAWIKDGIPHLKMEEHLKERLKME